MKSKIFDTDKYKEIEAKILTLLNSQADYLSSRTAGSPRAAGDAMQDILSEEFQSILGDVCAEYSASFARRAMADLAFTDRDGLYYVVDVKTHRLGTAFSMPNLTSVERLARFYEEDKNYFSLLMLKYKLEEFRAVVEKVYFVPIEFLSWDCLTVGALGWGQIQIANANTITLNEKATRKSWMLTLCDVMLEFYPREVLKINKRVQYFETLRQRWLKKSE